MPDTMSGTNTLVQSSQTQAASSIVTYDLALLLFRGIINIFFREVRPRGSFNIPREGPVIFVGAPHSNQVRLVILDRRRRDAKSSRTP
jgi:1-acyl-sn-glycerol-3-phosphate acyltransferase